MLTYILLFNYCNLIYPQVFKISTKYLQKCIVLLKMFKMIAIIILYYYKVYKFI